MSHNSDIDARASARTIDPVLPPFPFVAGKDGVRIAGLHLARTVAGLIIRWAQGVRAYMIHVPVCLGVAGKLVLAGSKGHMIIQWGGSLMGAPEVAYGSVALQSVPPASMSAGALPIQP